MPINTGEAFFHPVTHQLIQPGQYYDIPAYQEHENIEPAPVEEEVSAGEPDEVKEPAPEKASPKADKKVKADTETESETS